MRVTTSLKKQDGSRAIGTMLDRKGPAYSPMLAGKPYIGIASLFGKQYITEYKPVSDASGRVIGALFGGVNVMSEISALQDDIAKLAIGKSGYHFVVDAKTGAFFVHPDGVGQQADERVAPFRKMLKSREGNLTFDGENIPGADSRVHGGTKEISYLTMPQWNWMIGGIAYRDELLTDVNASHNRFLLIGAPLDEVTRASERIAAGDLTVRIDTTREDDISRLMRSNDGMARGLAEIVAQVRSASADMNEGTARIASGSTDIALRIATQAASVEETTAEQITSMEQQNAANTGQVGTLVASALDAARASGDAVGRVVSTMGEIDASARRIADITAAIEGIAFQTNILALNAAVELREQAERLAQAVSIFRI